MDEDEPAFVLPAEEVLDHPDIIERNGGGAVEAIPVVEDVARVRQQRLLAEALGERPDRAGEAGGQVRWRIGFAPDVGLDHEGVAHHGRTELWVGGVGAEGGEVCVGQLIEMGADTTGQQRARQAGCGFDGGGEIGRQGYVCGVMGAEIAPFLSNFMG